MTSLHQSRAKAEEAVEKIRVFAQPLRLMILSSLLEGERTVGAIEITTGIGQPALSQQLAELRRAELVRTRRVAKQVHYRLADEKAIACVRTIEAVFGADDLSAAPAAPQAVAVLRKPTSAHGAAMFAEIS